MSSRIGVWLFIAGVTARVAVLGIMWACLTLLAQIAIVFGWSHWWTKRRIDRLDDQVIIDEQGVVNWIKMSKTTKEQREHIRRYGKQDYWPSWFSLPYVGDAVTTVDGQDLVVTDVRYDMTRGMNIIEAERRA